MTTMTKLEIHDSIDALVGLVATDGAFSSAVSKQLKALFDAHLSKGAQVPDERVYAPLPSDADEYDRGHVDGWNACRQVMLSQRGED